MLATGSWRWEGSFCVHNPTKSSRNGAHEAVLIFQTDPLGSVSKLSVEDKAEARNQTIPSLEELLQLAKQHNISVMFDLYSPNWENDTEDVVDVILRSGIDPGQVSPPESPLWYRLTKISQETGFENKANFIFLDPVAPSSKTRVCEEGRARFQAGLQQEWNAEK